MKNQEYIHEEYRKECQYCEHGMLSYDETVVLCPKKGMMPPDFVCKKYVYDPLKRKPMKSKTPAHTFTAEEFQL